MLTVHRWSARTGVAAVAMAVLAAVMALPAQRADAAGIITHAWMAERAVERLDRWGDRRLAALLRAHPAALRAGAEFPDGGYLLRSAGQPGGEYAEEAHWPRFTDAYLAALAERAECGDLLRRDGPCAAAVAHLFGVVAHGVGDEVWDWLFEPAATDHGELWIPPELADLIGPGGIEVQMDAVAVGDHGRGAHPPPDPTNPGGPADPALDTLVAAFAGAGRPDVTADALRAGRDELDRLRGLEVAGGPAYRDQLHAHMPWTSANLVTAPGGVDFAARAIAGVFRHLGRRLAGGRPRTQVVAVFPGPGARDVPPTGWERTAFLPGARPDGGGAANRIVAVLSSSLPYVPPGAPPGTHEPAALPPAAAALLERATGRPVPQAAGYPRRVPYDPDPGGHTVAVQPAADLHPCTWYRVVVTPALRDAAGRGVRPAAWSFRTAGCPSAR